MSIRKHICLLLLILSLTLTASRINAQGWSFSATLTWSGPCGANPPTIPTVTIPYMPDKAFCESLRQSIVNIRSSAPVYDDHGKYIGECAVFYNCSACTGSDIKTSSAVSQPGLVSIDGLTQGTAFFSPHESEALLNWINDYNKKMQTMGVNVDPGTYLAVRSTPLTGDDEFDKYYAGEITRFEYPEQGGVVDLSNSKGVVDPAAMNKGSGNTVDILGSGAPLTPQESEMQTLYELQSLPDSRINEPLDASNFEAEEIPFWTSDDMMKLYGNAIKFELGLIPGGIGYPIIIGADIIAGKLSNSSKQEIFIDIAGDLAVKGIGDIGAADIAKGALGFGELKAVKNGSITLPVIKEHYESVLQAGQAIIDGWDVWNKAKKKK